VTRAAIAGLGLLFAAMLPAAAAEPSAAGLWQRSEDGKPVVWVLMIDRGGGIFEGVVAKSFSKPGTPLLTTCTSCTDDRKNAPILGISLIRDMKKQGLEYLDGNILDPRNGDVWKAQLTVSADGQALTLRGYLLTPMLGMDETWERLPDTAIAQLDPAIVAKFLPTQAAAIKPGGAPGAPKPGAAPAAATAPTAGAATAAKPKTPPGAMGAMPAPAAK
jgi:uncharacterized protein (DUF2147 family)